jgi:2-polyprenyl-6-methoxyphenol hydroxylase-like FAD-dependent oxidoreductase
MRIVIIGAGISGLSTYLFLRKHLPTPSPPAEPHTIYIYETYDTTRGLNTQDGIHPGAQDQVANSIAIGGGLGIVGNGLNVLKRLDESLFHDVVRHGHSMHAFKMCNARGWTLARIPVKTRDEPPVTCVMLGRHALWNCLRVNVPDSAIVNKKVSCVVATAGEQKNLIKFADGSPDEEADLVIGADGLRSVVRRAIFSSGRENDKTEEPFPAHYE